MKINTSSSRFALSKLRKSKSGFTLIELLVVIGLMGALTALILPSLTADREEAIADVCDYNQAGTLRTLKEYFNVIGSYPSDLHTGLTAADDTAVGMEGLPDLQKGNMVTNIDTTRHELTANEAASLSAAGIASLCSGFGLNSTDAAEGVTVSQVTDAWRNDQDAAYTFDGHGLDEWEAETFNDVNNAGIVIALWVTPTVNWASGSGGNKDWTKGNVKIGIDIAGQCPVPTSNTTGGEPDFSYYMAYFKVYSDGSAAKLIGTSCPECGVINP